MSGAMIAFAVLALTISILLKTPKTESLTEAVFVNSTDEQTAVINPGGLIAEKGSLKFGEFALFQLTNEETELEFISAEFDEKTRAIVSARGRVNSGSMLAVNLLFESELTLLDDRIAASNRGGSFIFEKNAEANFTRVRVLSGSAKLTFLDSNSSELFEGILLSGEEAELTDEAIAEIFGAGDEIARVAAWNQKVRKFSSRFGGEGELVSKILEQLSHEKPNALLAAYNFVKEKLIFNPKVKEDFYTQQFSGLLAEAIEGDTEAMDDFLTNPDKKNRAQLQKVVAQATPFTHLFLTKSLSPSIKEKIVWLANLSAPFSAFAKIADLSTVNELNRNLVFISNDSDNTKHAQIFLNRAKSGIEKADTKTAKLLLAILQRDAKVINADWLDAWTAVNRARIVTDSDLAAAIIDQLLLVEFLVESELGELASDALQELIELLSGSRNKFSGTSLEKIAIKGSDLKNRILFLANLSGKMEFDEESYREWMVKRERIAAEKIAEEIAEEVKTTYGKPGRVARPQSELEKFLNLFKEEIDLPTSPTQAAEEELLSEDGENSAEDDEKDLKNSHENKDDVDIEWGEYHKSTYNMKDVWMVDINITNNNNTIIAYQVVATPDRGYDFITDVGKVAESSSDTAWDRIYHYYNGEAAKFGKYQLTLFIYDCEKLPKNIQDEICVMTHIDLSEIFEKHKEAGNPIQPTSEYIKYYDISSIDEPPSEIDKEEYLNLSRKDIPASLTQAAEEEAMSEEDKIPSFDQVSDLIEEQLLVEEEVGEEEEEEGVFENSKDTFLAMGEEFTLLIADKNLDDEQEISLLIESTEFIQLINKYMTEDSVKEYESMPDIAKSMFFMFGLVLVLPDSNSNIEEIITGDTATLSYTKDGGTFSGDETTPTDIIIECSVKMILEDGRWKWERSPLTNDNVICTAS